MRGQELSAPLGGGLRLHDGILVLIEGPDRFLSYLCVRKSIEWKKYVSVFLRREKGERNFASSYPSSRLRFHCARFKVRENRMNSPTDRCVKKNIAYLSWTLRRPDHFHGLRLYRLHGAGDRVPPFGWFSARWHGCVILHRCEHSNETRAQRGLGKRNAEFVFGFCETLNSPFKSKTLNNLPTKKIQKFSLL